MSNLYTKLFILIVLFAAVLRFFQLGSNPPSLDWDEASIGYNAYSILKTGKDEYGNFLPLSFRSFDDYKPPVYIYLTVPSVALFGLTEFAVRLPAAIVGVLAVIAVYFFVIELLEAPGTKKYISQKYSKNIALVSAFFLAISPWHLQFSRAAFEGNIGICFLIISLLFFFKGLKCGIYFLFFAISFVVSMYSYHSFRLINPILLIILCILFYKELLQKKLFIITSLLIIAFISFPIYLSFINPQGTGARLSMVTIFSDPTIQKFSAEQELVAKQQHNIIGEILYNRRIIFIPKIVQGYFDHFNFDFLFLHGDGGVQHHAYNMGMLYLWDFPFIIIGIIFLLKKHTRRILVLFLLFLLAPLPAAITTGTPHPVRAIAMIPAFQIFAASGFISFSSVIFFWFMNKNFFRRGADSAQTVLPGKKLFACLLIGCMSSLLLTNFFYYLYSYYIITPIKYGYFWQYGNKQAVLYAKQHENEYSHIVITYAYDQPYIYYLFYNKIDPSWYQMHWDYSGTGVVDRFYRKIGKYEFMNITSKQLVNKNTLLIGTPEEIPNGIGQTKGEIYFPDGRLAYKIVVL